MEYTRPPKAKLTEKERREKERLEDERLAALELMISDDDEEGSASGSNEGASDESSSLGLENSDDGEESDELEGRDEEQSSDAEASGDGSGDGSEDEESDDSESSESSERQPVQAALKVNKRKASELEVPQQSEKRPEKSGAVGGASFARPVPPYHVRFDADSTTTDHDVALFFSRELYIFDVAHLARKSETITAYFNTKQAAENAIAALKMSKFSSNESLASTTLSPGQCLLCWDDEKQRNRTCWWCVGEVTRADKNNGRGYVSVLSGRKPCSICAKFDHKAKSCPQNMSKRAKRKRREQELAAEKKMQHQANAGLKRVNGATTTNNNNNAKKKNASGSAKSRRAESATNGSHRAHAGQARGRGKAAVGSASGFRTVEHGGPVFSAVL